MEYEKKYKEALERAKVAHKDEDRHLKATLERIFPELKESEDEKIREWCISHFKGCINVIKDNDEYKEYLSNKVLAWLEKQGKHAEVEPKFHEGDWVVYDHRPYQVVELPKEGYINLGLRRNGKVEFAPSTYCRHWSIQDAKDGDVLASELSGSIFLFRGIKDNKIDFYCDYDTELEWPEHRFGINDTDQHYGSVEESQDIHPATKEQRDTLIKAMANAGYAFDFEKKEFKEIKPKILDPDKVIEWLNDQACQGWIEDVEVDKFVDKFKKDFGL